MCKTCKKCGAEKPHTEFSKDKRAKDGLQYYCRGCAKKWRKENSEYGKKWYAANSHLRKAINQSRRAKKKQALPQLTDNDKLALKLLAEEALLLGPNWHLDHIVPISKGGLHHPDNLQIVRASYNFRKNNKLWQERKYV